jgi:hypothetical protein
LRDGTMGWVSASLHYVEALNAEAVPVVGTPPESSSQREEATRQPPMQWVLVANSAADFPGPAQDRKWWYLWSSGRNNFEWQEMAGRSSAECYRSPNDWNLSICGDSITTDPRGDVAVQWKAQKGGTYRFEWDSPALRFYKHLDFVGSQSQGTALPFSAIVKDVIDWEMFFWVAREDTPYHIRVFELQQ